MAELTRSTLAALHPDTANANKGTQRGRGALEASLRTLGAGRSILLDKHGNIIAGNKTAEVAGDIGMEDVLVVQTNGHQLVAVQRMDLDLSTDPSDAPMATVAVSLDGGNMLTGDFRKWAAFADVPEQWPHLYDEFWDGRGMPETFMPLESLTLYSDAPRCIWLYGNGLIDLRTAQVYLAYCEAHHG